MDEERVILLFQNKRKEFIKKSWISLALFMVGFLMTVIFNEINCASCYPSFSIGIILAAIISYSFFVVKNYRCPKCNQIPMVKKSRFSRKRIDMNPLNCSNCDAVLRVMTKDEIDSSERNWGIVALVISVSLFFTSLYIAHIKSDIFHSEERVYGKVAEVYKLNKSYRYKIKWVDNASGEVVSQTTKTNDIFMFRANVGDTGEFILYDNNIYPSSWTEFYLFPFTMFLISIGFLISALRGFGIIKNKKDD